MSLKDQFLKKMLIKRAKTRRLFFTKTRAVLGFRCFGFRGVWNMLSFGMVVLDMSWLVFMYAVKKKKDLSRTMEVDQRGGLC